MRPVYSLAALSCSVAVVLGGLLLPAGIASGQDDLKPVLEARYAAMKSAMSARDADAVAAMLAPGFVSVDASGKTETAAQMTAGVGALQADPKRTSSTTIVALARAGDTVTVDQRYQMDTEKADPDGTVHHVRLEALSTDTWVKPDGLWLMSKTVTNEMTYAVDGEVVFHRVRQ